MDLGDLCGMPKVSGGKLPATRAIVQVREVDDTPPTEAPKSCYKRPSDASIQQADDLAQRHKKVKILSRRHKSRHGKGGSRSHSKGKEPATQLKSSRCPSSEVGKAEELDEDLEQLVGCGGVREGTSASAVGTGTMALFDRVHDAGRLITFMDYHITSLQQEIDALKSRGGPEAVVVAEERASELKRSSRRQSVSDMKRSNGSKYPTKN
ncbi:hypothetical protein B296_00003344 [Ensete ventricosum]|uniref:Uncharacterized protein n=1 Tax=Ensete ventricosum TaxID=4639 RepID=A0A427AAG4_ENSVE|nr:hypothetical protein B296_00003344 [Ensete ventricosum]